MEVGTDRVINSLYIYVGEKVCIHPSLDNSSRLIKISHYKGKDVLYVGDPYILYFSGIMGINCVNFLSMALQIYQTCVATAV